MRNFYFNVIALLITISGISQDCQNPVSSVLFQQKSGQLAAVRNEQKKLQLAIDFVHQNCLFAYQVKELAGLFHDDYTRLSFAEAAYCSTLDRNNFYDVYDAFNYFSAVMRLHDFILSQNNPNNHVHYQGGTFDPYNFPNYNYPAHVNYNYETRCNRPISNEEFYMLLNSVVNQRTDELRVIVAVRIAEDNCMSVEQIMKMASYIRGERFRLNFLKGVYPYSYDTRNYKHSRQLFNSADYQREFDVYLRSRSRRTQEPSRRAVNVNNDIKPVVVCKVGGEEMKEIIAAIKDRTFNDAQVSTAKQIVKSKRCFTSNQIKRIVAIFSFESSKLDMAKYCYYYCIDKENYCRVNDAFNFSSSINKLNQYIKDRN